MPRERKRMQQQQAFTTSQVGARVGLSARTIQREIKAGELRAFRTRGGHYRVSIAETEQYIARINATTATNEP